MGVPGESLLVEIYKDIASPVARQAGVALGEVAKLIFSPIYHPTRSINKRLENWINHLEKDVPPDNRIEALPNITIPTLQQLALQQDETILGEMFYNILKSSIDKTKQQFLSPAFPRLLEQLTRDEAVMLLLLKDNNYKVELESQLNIKDYRFYNKHILSNEFPVSVLDYPDNLWLYSDHLNHLNLAGCWEYKNQEPIFLNELQTGVKIFSEFKLTEFGLSFAAVCISDKCKEFIK